MCGVIDAHGARSERRLHHLLDLEFSILSADHDQRPVAAARKDLIAVCLDGIDARADGQVGHNLAVIRAHHDQLLRIPAANEQQMVLLVEGQSHRMAAGRNRPARHHTARLQVDHRHDILILEVDIDFSGAVRSKKFRCAAEFDRRIDLAIHGIDIRLESHQLIPVAGDSEDQILPLVINNAVRIGHGSEFAQDGIRLEIEDQDGAVAAAIGDEAAAERRNNRRSVRTLLSRNIAQNLAARGVDDHGVRAARDKQPMRLRINGQIVPSAVATDVHGLRNIPFSLGQSRHGTGHEHRHRQHDRLHDSHLISPGWAQCRGGNPQALDRQQSR